MRKRNIIPLFVLPLRGEVVYPNMVVPLLVGRKQSVRALESALKKGKQIFLVAQKDEEIERPRTSEIYKIGTIANVLQVLKLPDKTVKILVEGIHRAEVVEYKNSRGVISAETRIVVDFVKPEGEIEILMHTIFEYFDEYVNSSSKLPGEILSSLSGIADPGRFADAIAAHLPLKVDDKQRVLETVDTGERLELVLGLLQMEMEMLRVEEKIRDRVKNQVDQNQREFLLHEKLKAVQKELGELDERGAVYSELEKIKAKIEAVGLSGEAKEKALAEYNKLKITSPMSPESSVSRNYLDWLLKLPWKKCSKINKDLLKAEEVLENEHYGLKKVKERIIEYLAVQQRAKKVKGPILCLVGPPGVGKTSLGQSIARATGREFVRIALGGVRDEAEIRGHRKTYIGSLPGKILQKMAKCGVKNPLFMLDEVDKIAMDFRGDPAAALIEVLDPEQNYAFNDHYLEIDYDLSDVMFVTTANCLDMPAALLDRMEVIHLSGYTEDEKLHIAKRYLIPKQMKNNGVKKSELAFVDDAILNIIRYYTQEAGVRNLEREISKICRKVVKDILLKEKGKSKVAQVKITPKTVEKYLGVRKYLFGLADKKNRVGQVTGLAWTEVGGDLLTIEVAVLVGKGKSLYTGQLGDVMQESIQAAVTVARSRSAKLGIAKSFYEKTDIHVHVPEGATPKDGPSAGIGMCVALVSALTKIPVKADVAMTGEITLRGEVLPIGGLKEKLLAALRGGIKTVIIPKENEKDLKELPKNVIDNLKIIPVQWIDEVLKIALEKMPKPKKKK